MMKLSLVISSYNQPAALAKVLRGVALQTRWPEEIVVADDGSEEPTRRLVADWSRGAKVPVHYSWQPHEGFRKTIILNQAIRKSMGDYLVFLDGDCVPHRRFIADHHQLAESGFWVQGRRCFIKEPFAARFEPGKTPVWLWMLFRRVGGSLKGLRLPWPVLRRGKRQRGIIGCNLGCWRADLEAVNGYDEAYTGWGGEDSDLGSRLYHLGRSRKFVYGRAIVYHLNHPPVATERAQDNFARLAETLRLRRVRCERGLAQHV